MSCFSLGQVYGFDELHWRQPATFVTIDLSVKGIRTFITLMRVPGKWKSLSDGSG